MTFPRIDGVEIPDGFDVVLRPELAVDPEADADGTRRAVDVLRAAGATMVNLRLVARSRDHWIAQLARAVDLLA